MKMTINSESKSIHPRKGGGWLSPFTRKLLFIAVALIIHPGAGRAQTEVVELSTRTPIWSFNPHLYMTNMTVTCQAQIDGLPVDTAYEIGAFCGSECRGDALVEWSVTKKHFVAYMTIMGNWQDAIVFRLYDHRHQAEITSVAPPSTTWIADEILGTAKSPYVLNFTATSLHETDASTPQVMLFSGKWDEQIFQTKDDSRASVIDLTAVDGLPSVRPATLNPNAIVYVPASSAQTFKDGDNVAVPTATTGEWTAQRVVIKDGYPYSSDRIITATSACFQRTYSADVTTTLCLPFDFIVTNGNLYTIDKVYDGKLHLSKQTDSKGTANTPYLFVPTSTGILTINGNKNEIVVKTVGGTHALYDDKGIASNFNAVCNYDMHHSVVSDDKFNYYGWADDKTGALNGAFVRCITGAYANAFRVYIFGPSSTDAKQLDVSIDEDVTAIPTLDVRDEDSIRMNVYNLSGVLLMRSATIQEALDKLPKGIYVIGKNKIKLLK